MTSRVRLPILRIANSASPSPLFTDSQFSRGKQKASKTPGSQSLRIENSKPLHPLITNSRFSRREEREVRSIQDAPKGSLWESKILSRTSSHHKFSILTSRGKRSQKRPRCSKRQSLGIAHSTEVSQKFRRTILRGHPLMQWLYRVRRSITRLQSSRMLMSVGYLTSASVQVASIFILPLWFVFWIPLSNKPFQQSLGNSRDKYHKQNENTQSEVYYCYSNCNGQNSQNYLLCEITCGGFPF